MRYFKLLMLVFCLLLPMSAVAKKPHTEQVKHKTSKHSKLTKHASTRVATTTHTPPPMEISSDDIVGFNDYPRDVKKLISDALAISAQHLPYRFGSDNPDNNGLDCSGAITYLLKESAISDVPRQADQIYQWAWENGEFSAVNSKRIGSFEFSKLKPGDLLFWSGTYPVQRDTDVTHVMMYIGRDKQNRPLMFGASASRYFKGKPQDGVGVFSFNMPSGKTKARFLGYACVPHLTCDA